MKFLAPHDDFPPVETANDLGLLAVGGDLSPQRLLKAYNSGVFPWYDKSQPILWWSPDPRMVLFPENLKVSRSMKQLLKKDLFEISYNTAFKEVISSCALMIRNDQNGTWITSEMQEAYVQLHKLGIAQSVEVWQEGKLVAGAYGILLKEKRIFCGESMFTKVSNGSKYGFIHLVGKLQQEGIAIIDCQVYTDHLASLGAEEIPRQDFMKYLRN